MANKYSEMSKVNQARQALQVLHSCEQKRRYETEQEAANGWNQKIYRCGNCGGYHRSSFTPRRALGLPSLIKGRGK